MTSTDTLLLLKKHRTANSPPVEGWQAQPDGVVFCIPTICRVFAQPQPLRAIRFMNTVGADHSPPVEVR